MLELEAAVNLFLFSMKSTGKSLSKAKASKAAPVASPASDSRLSQHGSPLKFNADMPVYASSALGSSRAGAFVVGGGGGRAKTGVQNGLHVLVSPFENPKCAGEGNSMPLINLGDLMVRSVCSSGGKLFARTVENIVSFGASVGSDSQMAETSRLSLNFAKSAASIAGFDGASDKLKDAVSKNASAEVQLELSRALDKALIELDSQNVSPRG